MASCTAFSFTLSKAEVASSRSSILGFFMKARAMATLYFCPPDKDPPEPPTIVSIPRSIFWMKSHALASIKAYLISSSVASGLANSMFSFIEVLNRTGSWPTYPMARLIVLKSRLVTSILSRRIVPLSYA